MPKFAANLSMLFTEVDFPARFQAAAQAGFAAVECQFPYAYDKDRLAELLTANGLTMVLHNLPPGDWAAGERGIACLPEREAEFADGVGTAIQYAKALGCGQLNCLAGLSAQSPRAEETLVSNLKFAADALAKEGIRLLIEAINTQDMPGFFVNRTAQALRLIALTGSDNIFLQYDCYHMQIMEGDLAPTIQRHLPRIAHIQIADAPGRHEPGTGDIDYPTLFDRLDAMGYAGWAGCEYRPKTTTLEGLGWLRSLG